MAYRKYYILEFNGAQILGCDTADNENALDVVRAERDNEDNNIPSGAQIYSFDIDETQPAELKVCNKEFVE